MFWYHPCPLLICWPFLSAVHFRSVSTLPIQLTYTFDIVYYNINIYHMDTNINMCYWGTASLFVSWLCVLVFTSSDVHNTFAQSWRYKPGQYIAGASGCGPPALPYKGLDNGPSSSSSSAPLLSIITGRREQHQDSRGPRTGAASGQPRPTGRQSDTSPRQTSSIDDLSAWHSAPSAPTHSGRHVHPASWLGGVCGQAWRQRRRSPWRPLLIGWQGLAWGWGTGKAGATTAHGPGSARHL